MKNEILTRAERRMMERCARKGVCIWCGKKIIGGPTYSFAGCFEEPDRRLEIGPQCGLCAKEFREETKSLHPKVVDVGWFVDTGKDQSGEPVFERVDGDGETDH